MAKRERFQPLIKKVERSQDEVVAKAFRAMREVMQDAVDYIWDHFEKTGHYHPPTLNKMYQVNLDFYRHLLERAVAAASVSKKANKEPVQIPSHPPMRLAAKPGPWGLPRSLKDFVHLFEDKRYWPKVMKRSKKLTDRLRAIYLKKLERKFKKVTPLVVDGQLSPDQAKAGLMEEWETTKSRVTLIYRTETTNYFAKVQVNFYSGDKEIIGFLFDSVRDSGRTEICRSRHGLVYRPNTPLLTENTPACFLGSTPVLTTKGYTCIDTLSVGDYVWTHENRWRKITGLHCSPSKFQQLLQIGYAVATPNHPYLSTGGDFVAAIEIRDTEEGVWSVPGYLRCLWQGLVGAILMAKPKILFDVLSSWSAQRFSEGHLASMLHSRTDTNEGRLCRSFDARPSRRTRQWVCVGTPPGDGSKAGPATAQGRSGSPHQPHQKRQPSGEPGSVFQRGAHEPSYAGNGLRSQGPKEGTEVLVYNLDVEGDHTYVAGGFVVHNCHFNCRSHVIPLADTPSNRKMLEDPSRDPEKRKVAPLPEGWRKS